MSTHHRRAFRHAVDLRCQIVRARDFRVVADRAVDLSTDGMQVLTEEPVLTGEPVLVTFRIPRSAAVWIDAEAFVTRVIHGRRPGERGRRLGIAFHGIEPGTRTALFRGLRTLPPASLREAREHARR